MLNINRIDHGSADAAEAISAIRKRLSPDAGIVSAAGRQRTIDVFGDPLSPQQVVERICNDVASQGLAAALDYSRKLDKADVTAATLRVSANELQAAHAAAPRAFLDTVRRIRANILAYQSAILKQDSSLKLDDHELRLTHRPLARVGICIPGGAAAYPSTVLMSVVPAQVAGVGEIAIVAPPTPFGANNPDLLAVCHELGVREVYRIGGAQAVAMLAYGVEGVRPVDKIVGPGNLFVALAKLHVSNRVGIDMMAGPSEVLILADETAIARHIASDMIAQAEHAPGASILVTWAPELVDQVANQLDEQLQSLERSALARESLEAYGALILCRNEAEACLVSDQFAPEHLEIMTADPEATLSRIHNAGAVFLGDSSPVAVGDYVAGPSHTLPTGGQARFASGLSANDFLRGMSVIRFSRQRLAAVAEDLFAMANVEGLTAHARSVKIRLQ